MEATRDPIAGEHRLVEAVGSLRPNEQRPLDEAQTILRSVLSDTPAHDDVALLTVYFEGALSESNEAVARWAFPAHDVDAAHDVRAELERALRANGMNADDVFAAEMIFVELLGNVVRHAGAEVVVLLDCSSEKPVLHVLDAGSGFSLNPKLPTDAYSECGRGLYIVTRLARDFSVTPRTNVPGSHARAVLPGRVRAGSAGPSGAGSGDWTEGKGSVPRISARAANV